jgi:hypothetical protein
VYERLSGGEPFNSQEALERAPVRDAPAAELRPVPAGAG